MLKKSSLRFKIIAFLLCLMLLVAGFVPAMNVLRPKAANNITIYFDTSSCPSTAVQGWSNTMNEIYYAQLTSKPADNQDYYCNFSSSHKMTEDPSVSIVKGTTGKMFKVTIDIDNGAYISFSPWFGTQKGTASYPIMTYPEFKLTTALDNKVVYFENKLMGGRFQKVWYTDLASVTTYEGDAFKIANMTDTSLKFDLVYSNGTVAEDKTVPTSDIAGRATGVSFNVPENTTGTKKPYTEVSIKRNTDGVLLKNIKFADGEILGRTFYYGVSEFHDSRLSYGDGKTLCFKGNDFTSKPSVTKKLYFSNDHFPAGATVSIKTNDGTFPTTAMTTEGNANFVTSSTITIDAGEIFSVIVTIGGNTDTYNLSLDNTTDNLVIISDNVASVCGTYTVQSIDNTYNGQKYITIETDMFDYQYDKFKYKYNYNDDSGSGNNGSWGDGISSQEGKGKRPYVAVNTAISKSPYGTNSTYPLYLGQFWLPDGKVNGYSNSDQLYSSSTLKQRAGSNNNANYTYYNRGDDGGIQKGNGTDAQKFACYFGFGDILNNFHWKPNLALRTSDQAPGTYKPYDAVVQGLVNGSLTDGVPTDPNGTYKLPYFDESFWKGTETSKMGDGWNDNKSGNASPTQSFQKSDYMVPYEDLPFPFFEINASDISYKNNYSSDRLLTDDNDVYGGKYYLFDSQKHSVKVDASTKKLDITGNTGTALVYDNYGDGYNTNSQPGFFPFNSTSDSNTKNLHYGFGVSFTVDFYLTEKGTINDEADGTAITFTFQGDDDVWVFLDDKLILDMGGGHKNAIGEINFKNKTTYIGSGASVTSSPDSLTSTGEDSISKTFSELGFNANDLKTGKHKIKMFYLERGMLNSNLYVMFNLPLSLTKWELQEDTSFDGVNAGFLDATKVVADNDVFNYEVYNKGTAPSAVVGSSYKSTTIDSVSRVHRVDGTDYSTTLATGTTPSVGTTNQTVTKPGRIYLDFGSISWGDSEAKFAAVMKDSSDNKLYAPFKWDRDVSKWYVDYNANYNDKIKLLRINPGASRKYCGEIVFQAFETSMGIKTKDNSFVWNMVDYFSLSSYPNKNTIRLSGWDSAEWSNTLAQQTKTVPNYAQYYHTNNYVPDSDVTEFYPVKDGTNGVSYMLTDDYSAKDVIYDSRAYGNEEDKNVISMQYSEMATLSRQFAKSTTIKVVQKDELSAPSNGSRYTAYDDTVSRSSSFYYTMFAKPTGSDSTKKRYYAGVYDGSDVASIPFDHVDTMYSGKTNYADDKIVYVSKTGNTTTHTFTDPNNASNEYVHLRQVIVNNVNTAKLTVSKEFLTTESDTTTSFNFTIFFNNVFGATTGDGKLDYGLIKYTKYSGSTVTPDLPLVAGASGGGTFSLKAGDYIEISGIPVGTRFYLSEDPDTTYELSRNHSVKIGSTYSDPDSWQSVDEDTYSVAFNRRKTGLFSVNKLVYNDNGTALLSSDSTEFDAVVTLTAPAGVDLAEYDIRAGSSNVNLDSNNSFTIKIKHNDPVQITGLPYGTHYIVIESPVPSGYAKLVDFIESGYFIASGDNVGYNMSDHTIHGTNDNTGSGGIVHVYNKFEPIVMPTTGGSGIIFIFPIGIIAVALSGGAFVIYRRRLTAAARAERSER